mgnify:CR=1 FL=1
MNKKKSIKIIETHLRNYRSYKVAIRNLQNQLDLIMPNVTTSYELKEGSTGVFKIWSTTEQVVLDRLESARALQIDEQIRNYQIIIDSIEEALNALGEQERLYVELRYFEGLNTERIADKMSCSIPNLFRLRKRVLDRLSISLSNVNIVYGDL